MLAAERGEPGERYVLSGATLSVARGARASSPRSPACARDVRFLPAAGRARPPARSSRARFRAARASTPPVCREMVRTLLHGHRYDGSRAARELGLRYTPVADTFRRTIEWARAEGLVASPGNRG